MPLVILEITRLVTNWHQRIDTRIFSVHVELVILYMMHSFFRGDFAGSALAAGSIHSLGFVQHADEADNEITQRHAYTVLTRTHETCWSKRPSISCWLVP